MDLHGSDHCPLARLRVSGADKEIIVCLTLLGVIFNSAVACLPPLPLLDLRDYVGSFACSMRPASAAIGPAAVYMVRLRMVTEPQCSSAAPEMAIGISESVP